MSDLLNVWTPDAVLSALIGGFLLGILLLGRFGDNPGYSALTTLILTISIGAFAGLVFWSGQIMDTYLSSGPSLATRVVGRFALFILFIVTTAIGTGINISHRRGNWHDLG